VPNIMNLGVCFMKKLYLSKLACLLDTASNFALFSVSSLKDKKLIKSKPTQKLKHENSILESFEFLPNFIKIDRYNFELYRSKLTRFFETQYSNDNTSQAVGNGLPNKSTSHNGSTSFLKHVI